LKNYLFSIAVKDAKKESSEIDILQGRWAIIVDMVGLKNFPIFLRYYLNAKQKLVRKEQLFKNIKNTVNSSDKVFVLLDELEKKQVYITPLRIRMMIFGMSILKKMR